MTPNKFSAGKANLLELVTAVLLLLLTIFSVGAHDYRFEAADFSPAENEQVIIHMLVGTRPGIEEERPLQSPRPVFFKLFSPGGISDFQKTSKDVTPPVVTFRTGKSGTYLPGTDRHAVANILDAQKFNASLRKENLTKVTAERARQRGK